MGMELDPEIVEALNDDPALLAVVQLIVTALEIPDTAEQRK